MAGHSKSRRNYGYGSVYQRKPRGSWTIDYRTSEGKRIQKTVKGALSKTDAIAALRDALKEEFQGVESTPCISFSEYSDLFLENYSVPNKRSWKCDYYALNAHLKPFFKSFRLHEVTPLHIEKFRAEKLRAGLARSSTNRLLALLKRMFSVAEEWDYVKGNPVKAVRMFSERENMRERVLTEDEERRLLKESADHLKPIITVALNTGMRKNEILTLTWNQVDLGERLIRVVKTKSGRSRSVPVNDTLYRVLKVFPKMGKPIHVFPDPKTGKPYKEVRTSWEGACRRAGIKLRFHDLRHTFACRLVQRGCDIETLRALLGHHSISITERYVHTNEKQKREAVGLLSAVRDTAVTLAKGIRECSLFSVN